MLYFNRYIFILYICIYIGANVTLCNSWLEILKQIIACYIQVASFHGFKTAFAIWLPLEQIECCVNRGKLGSLSQY